MILGLLTPEQLQTIVLAYAAVVGVIIPIVGSLVVLALKEWANIKQSMGKVDAINGQIATHANEINTLTAQSAKHETQLNGTPSTTIPSGE